MWEQMASVLASQLILIFLCNSFTIWSQPLLQHLEFHSVLSWSLLFCSDIDSGHLSNCLFECGFGLPQVRGFIHKVCYWNSWWEAFDLLGTARCVVVVFLLAYMSQLSHSCNKWYLFPFWFFRRVSCCEKEEGKLIAHLHLSWYSIQSILYSPHTCMEL